MGNLLDKLSIAHQEVIEHFKGQLLIVLMKRLGGDLRIPLAEMDDTYRENLSFSVDPVTKEFHFVITPKDYAG